MLLICWSCLCFDSANAPILLHWCWFDIDYRHYQSIIVAVLSRSPSWAAEKIRPHFQPCRLQSRPIFRALSIRNSPTCRSQKHLNRLTSLYKYNCGERFSEKISIPQEEGNSLDQSHTELPQSDNFSGNNILTNYPILRIYLRKETI